VVFVGCSLQLVVFDGHKLQVADSEGVGSVNKLDNIGAGAGTRYESPVRRYCRGMAARRVGVASGHGCAKRKARRGEPFFFLSPYYQDTKFSYKVCRVCWGILAGKGFGMWGRYFRGAGSGLTVFPHSVAGFPREPGEYYRGNGIDCDR
jgi:hypothetical protein